MATVSAVMRRYGDVARVSGRRIGASEGETLPPMSESQMASTEERAPADAPAPER